MKLISALKENDLVEHPRGGLSFGVIPEIPHLKLPEGNIYLRRGAHDAVKIEASVLSTYGLHTSMNSRTRASGS